MIGQRSGYIRVSTLDQNPAMVPPAVRCHGHHRALSPAGAGGTMVGGERAEASAPIDWSAVGKRRGRAG